jgi:hypothetical protein
MSLTRHLLIAYEHLQDTASTTWVIQHNLGVYPVVDTFVLISGEYQKMIPASVTYDNENQCTVAFSTAREGFATVA